MEAETWRSTLAAHHFGTHSQLTLVSVALILFPVLITVLPPHERPHIGPHFLRGRRAGTAIIALTMASLRDLALPLE